MGASSTVTDHGSTIMEALLLSKILVHLVILHGYPKTGNTIIFQALWSSRYTISSGLDLMKKKHSGNNSRVAIPKTLRVKRQL